MFDNLGQIGAWGIPIIHSPHVPRGRAFVFADPTMTGTTAHVVVIDMTRPTLHFPLTEALAKQDPKIDLWYFDRSKWPHRMPDPIWDELKERRD